MAKLSDLTKEQLLEIYIEKKFKKILKEELGTTEPLDELSLTGLGNIGSKIIGKTDAFADKLAGGIENGANAIKDKAVGFGKNVADTAVNATNAVKDKATEIGGKISAEYDRGVMSDLDARIMVQLGKIKEAVNKYNELAIKNGQPKINARKYMSFLNTIK